MTLLKLLTVLLTALAFAPGAAHLFELPAKIGMDREAYFTVQRIYAGWALFGVALFGALLANLALFFLASRAGEPVSGRWGLAAAGLIALSLAVFFIRVFPTNQASSNWTMAPENWDALRRQWEYGHAANAVILFAALAAATLAATVRR